MTSSVRRPQHSSCMLGVPEWWRNKFLHLQRRRKEWNQRWFSSLFSAKVNRRWVVWWTFDSRENLTPCNPRLSKFVRNSGHTRQLPRCFLISQIQTGERTQLSNTLLPACDLPAAWLRGLVGRKLNMHQTAARYLLFNGADRLRVTSFRSRIWF